MSKPLNEIFISVDVETAGPNPSDYSLLSIGACTVFEPQESFYVEIQPVNDNFTPEAISISGLGLVDLQTGGTSPQEAMASFARWLKEVTPENNSPIFVAFNAPFDWMFINDYFYRFLGYNPFGHKALDVKAFYMGFSGVSWDETGMDHLSARYLKNQTLSHHALQDALDQAEIFRRLLAEN